jgi:uncharacterized iron-regulated protein
MTLEDFVETYKKRLDAFAKQYKAQHDVDPANWPANMAENDWEEQLMFFGEEDG